MNTAFGVRLRRRAESTPQISSKEKDMGNRDRHPHDSRAVDVLWTESGEPAARGLIVAVTVVVILIAMFAMILLIRLPR
jgi:hypothetical protein